MPSRLAFGHSEAPSPFPFLALVLLSIFLPFETAQAAAPAGYYASVDLSTPEALAETLHAVIDDHTRFPYTSSATDTWDILELAQQDPGSPGAILDVYRNASYPKQGGGNASYNREHTWPKSFGFPNDGAANSVYTDAHLLHLSDGSYNSSRGNRPYGDCDASCTSRATVANEGQGGGVGPYPDDDNWTAGGGGVGGSLGRWEVWTGRRGDVARSLLYADLRYEGGVHGVTGFSEPDLVLTDDESLVSASNTGSNEAVAYMGILSDLLAWHAEDPVDDFERHRNDVVFSFQGNRNPFVDHPEWVEMLFTPGSCVTNLECDDGVFCNGPETCDAGICRAALPACGADMTCDEASLSCSSTPSAGGIFLNEIHYDNAGADVGEFLELAGPAGASLSGWTLVGLNGATGQSYTSLPLEGVFPDQGGCAGALVFALAGIQNGAPDGLVLLDQAGEPVQFLSYEGSFIASAGQAAGQTSENIGASESSSTPVGHSLQLAGTGRAYADFVWQTPQVATPGAPNAGQTLSMCVAAQVPTSRESSLILLLGGLLGTGLLATAGPGMAIFFRREASREKRT